MLNELTDLGIALTLLCIPIATAAIFIPVGRAIARRISDRVDDENTSWQHQ
jgi:hypothetical protein